MKKTLFNLAKALLAVAILVYLFRKTDVELLWIYLRGAEWSYVGLAALVFGGALFLIGVRWHVLLSVLGLRYGLGRVYAISLIGFFFNAFLLGSTGGDLVKALYLLRQERDRLTQVISSIAVDRIIGMVTVVMLGSFALAVGAGQLEVLTQDSNILTVIEVFAVVVFTGMGVLLFFPFSALPEIFQRLWQLVPMRGLIARFYRDMQDFRRQWPLTLRAVLLSVVSQLCTVVAVYWLSCAVGLEVTFMQMLIIVPVIFCAIGLPISIGGHGVREGMFVLLYTSFGIVGADDSGKAAAMAVSFLFLGISLLWTLIGGGVFLAYRQAGNAGNASG